MTSTELQVVLIGGPPGAGKTTLCRGLGARLGFLSTTVDDLVATAQFVSDPERHPGLHRATGIPATTYFTEGPPQRLTDDAEALAEAMWPSIERLVRRHIADALPVVLDWWLFDPDRVAALIDDVGEHQLGSIWLHIDGDELDRRERQLADFRAGSADPDRMHEHFMHRSRWRNDLIDDRANALGLPVIHQPGGRSVDELVDEAVRRLGGAGPAS